MGKLYFIYVVFELFCSHDNAVIFWSSEIEDTQSFKYILSFVIISVVQNQLVFPHFIFMLLQIFLGLNFTLCLRNICK